MNNPDIHFGEIEEPRLDVRLRPDRDSHYAVAVVGEPREDDLPIFADLDTMIELEEHALGDTRVELGGVLLGGHYQDSDGKPFVLLAESLRAQHYESTKGSFKFTHETWQEMTRQREGFSDEMQVVGWYHTHPGWGVFLSGMDLFICEHFFRRPLDLALVIDPCRGERGFFQWTHDTPRQVRQTAGFYLVASRFRRHELEAYARLFQGEFQVAQDPRLRGLPPAAQPIVIHDPGRSWLPIAFLGLFTIQLAVIALLAWQVLPTAQTTGTAQPVEQAAQAAQFTKNDPAARFREQELNAKLGVLDEVLDKAPGGQQGLIQSLVEKSAEVQELRSAVRGQRALQSESDRRLESLQADLKRAQERNEQLAVELDRLQTSLAELRKRSEQQTNRIAELQGDSSGEDSESAILPSWKWAGAILGGVAGFLVLGGAVAGVLRWRRNHSEHEPDPDESPESTNRD